MYPIVSVSLKNTNKYLYKDRCTNHWKSQVSSEIDLIIHIWSIVLLLFFNKEGEGKVFLTNDAGIIRHS